MDFSTGKVIAMIVGFLMFILIVAGCNIAVAAFQPDQMAPMYQGEMDD